MKLDAVFGLDQAAWPALLVDGGCVIRRANPAAVRFFGPALEGESPLLSAIWVSENGATAEQFLAQWERSPVSSVALKFRSKGGLAAPHLTFMCAIHRDEQKYFVLQLWPETSATAPARAQTGEASPAQKQKLDCALQLARTVSLDFNNALTSILGHSSLLLSKLEANHPWRGSLLEIEKSAARAAEIANDLGAFSRQEKETRPQADGNLNLLVQRTVEFCQQSVGAQPVAWSLQLERKLFAAKFDEAKMQQALVKVLENALQALTGNGRISVRTQNVELSQAAQDRNVQLAAGAYVCVEISDNGCGIPAEVLPRIFEPFFTTKKEGNHRGLGLAWVYGIVTNNGGGVAVSSQPGAGTSVRVYLPAEKRILKHNGVHAEDLSGTQTVLMVDDEDLLLTMGHAVLSAFGYRVLTASSGQKALEILQQPDHSVELVVTDLVMPAMSGRELVEHIHRVSPHTRVLCTSGCVWPVGQQTNGAYLQKPFTSQELLLKVKQSLSGEGGNEG
jgi:two-component system, cell cycle sensor histidine kinase and response regulator CckA